MTDPDIDSTSTITKLVAGYPRLFRGQHPKVMSSLPKGWMPLVQRLLDDLDAMLDDTQAQAFTVVQIKEKYAGLRVYWSLDAQQNFVLDLHDARGTRRVDLAPKNAPPIYERISARIALAEAESARICERCGSPGVCANDDGWLVTLCESCRVTGPR